MPASDRFAEQLAAEEALAGDDWPDRDPQQFALSRRLGHYLPVDDLPDIATYRPTA